MIEQTIPFVKRSHVADGAGLQQEQVRVSIHETAGLPRTQEPVELGIPWPKGHASAESRWSVCDERGQPRDCQTSVLRTWSDGSVRWLHVLVLATVPAHGAVEYVLTCESPSPGGPPARPPSSEESTVPDLGLQIPAPSCLLRVERPRSSHAAAPHAAAPHAAASTMQALPGSVPGSAHSNGQRIDTETALGLRLHATDARGHGREGVVTQVRDVSTGPVRRRLQLEGSFPRLEGLRWEGVLDWYPAIQTLSLALTLHNPGRARHVDNYWDLGDEGSILLKDCVLTVSWPCAASSPGREVCWLEHVGDQMRSTQEASWELYQDSSGGDAWNSRNHVNRDGRIPVTFRGYRVQVGKAEHTGLRASPAVALRHQGGWVATTVRDFWQQFPKGLAVDDEGLRVQLWPAQFNDLHELQGGERKTHQVLIRMGTATQDVAAALQAVVGGHEPLVARVDPAWLAATGAVANLPSPEAAARTQFAQLAREALSGNRSFFAKREVIDEYGWRNYGDFWADHETLHYAGPPPVISHYNNQYDGLQGCLLQFLRTGDPRWWRLGDALARHVMEIDIYHCANDRSAYSGGLFWHTDHYVDAGRSTHRTKSRTMIPQMGGGGPGCEHNYTSGLLLYYHLTGCVAARDAVVQLADWVLAMDRGDLHLLGVASSAPTGLSTYTSQVDYHAPGRGAGNSINALVDGFLATGHSRYLDTCDQLIRRTVHPEDDIASRQLDDAELRWSYTVYFQSLFRYLEVCREAKRTGSMYDYARQSLLHYARWMEQHETFYLDRVEKLEFPTETWPAQEIRKGNVLLMAALQASPDERPRLVKRADEIHQRVWSELLSFPSATYTRPLVLALQLGIAEMHLRERLAQLATAPQERVPPAAESPPWVVLGPPEKFVSQRQQIRQALRSPGGVLKVGLHMLRPGGWWNAWRRSWLAQRLRRWWSRRW